MAGVLLVLLIGWRLLNDIRRRQRAEMELRISNAVIAATMNSIPQGISVFDRDLKLIAWNPQFASLRGIEEDDVRMGMAFTDVVRLGAQVEDVSIAAGLTPGVSNRREVFDRVPHVKELKRADGMMLEVRGQLREDGNYILTYTDITQLKRSNWPIATRLRGCRRFSMRRSMRSSPSTRVAASNRGAREPSGCSAIGPNR